MGDFIDVGSKIVAFGTLVAGAIWGTLKFRRRDEFFPRVEFEVGANFVGLQAGQVVVEVVVHLHNKGVVPVRIRDLGFKLRTLDADDVLGDGDPAIRGQTRIPNLLKTGSFVPAHWEHTFVYPGVRTEYNFVTTIPKSSSFARVEASFSYERQGSSHHAAKLLAVPCLPTA